jgi:hypothetical protein
MMRFLLAGLAVLICAAPAWAQSIAAPTIVPGDRWVYQSGIGQQSLSVTDVKPDGTIIAQLQSPTLGGQEVRFTKDWDPLVQPQAIAGQTIFFHYDPAVCVMPPSPWHVGQTWSCASKFNFSNRVGVVEVSGKIEAMEKITGPAGSFDALRVREKVGGTATTIWYAPAARQVIKIDAGANSPYSMQLTSYSVK